MLLERGASTTKTCHNYFCECDNRLLGRHKSAIKLAEKFLKMLEHPEKYDPLKVGPKTGLRYDAIGFDPGETSPADRAQKIESIKEVIRLMKTHKQLAGKESFSQGSGNERLLTIFAKVFSDKLIA